MLKVNVKTISPAQLRRCKMHTYSTSLIDSNTYHSKRLLLTEVTACTSPCPQNRLHKNKIILLRSIPKVVDIILGPTVLVLTSIFLLQYNFKICCLTN